MFAVALERGGGGGGIEAKLTCEGMFDIAGGGGIDGALPFCCVLFQSGLLDTVLGRSSAASVALLNMAISSAADNREVTTDSGVPFAFAIASLSEILDRLTGGSGVLALAFSSSSFCFIIAILSLTDIGADISVIYKNTAVDFPPCSLIFNTYTGTGK